MVQRALLIRLPRLLGAVLFLAGFAQHRSWGNREVLGLWSPEVAFVVATMAVVVIGLAIDVVRRAAAAHPRDVTAAGRLLDGAILATGAAYLASALQSQESAGRLLDGNLFGSLDPLTLVFEWFALALFASGALVWLTARLGARSAGAVLSLATFAVLWLVAEGAIRAKTALHPEPQGFPTWLDRAWKNRHVQRNREGFRDGEHVHAVAPGTRRLLVVGDSFAFGAGISDVRHRFGEQLAARLDPSRGAWEVVTAAEGGAHTLDQIGFLQRMLAYHPELVILVYVFNDIDYLSPPPSDNELLAGTPDGWRRFHPVRLLFLNSHTFQQLYVYGRLAGYQLAQRRGLRLITGLNLDRRSPYEDPELLARHLADISTFIAHARAAGAHAGVVPFDLGVLVDERHRERYRGFSEAALRVGIPIYDLEHAFTGHSFEELTLNRLDRHPNESGHRLAAEHVARALAH